VVSLTVSDDGVGFDPSRLGTSGGLGLIMMRERASQLNGTFEFVSAPGRGTTIGAAIPFR
jgi:signal transduction histidine kinase